MKFLLAISIILNAYLLIFGTKKRRKDHSAAKLFILNGMGKKVKKMNLKVNQKLPLNAQAEDKFGNKADLDGVPTWSVSDETLGAVNAAEDGLSAEFVPSGKEGTAIVQVLGQENGKALSGSLEVVLIAGDATTFVLQAGTPIDEESTEPTEPAPAPEPLPTEPVAE